MTEKIIPREQIISEGKELGNRLFNFGIALAKKIPKDSDKGEKETSRRAVLKGFLMSGCQLEIQIIDAVSRRHLILALIGLRSLLEHDINSNYIFDHPRHKHDLKWIYDHCKDIFDRTNDLGMSKNQLGGVGLKQRAKAIGFLHLYEKNYAGLSDYSHLTLRPPFLNKPEIYEKLIPSIISQCLCNLLGIIDSVIVSNNLSWEHDLKNDVIAYRDKYEELDRES